MKIQYDKLILNVISYRNYDIDKANKAFDKVDAIAKSISLNEKSIRHKICELALDSMFEKKDEEYPY